MHFVVGFIILIIVVIIVVIHFGFGRFWCRDNGLLFSGRFGFRSRSFHRRGWRDGLANFNFGERLRLHACELFQADQFQQREKSADDFRAVRGLFKQLGKFHRAALGEDIADKFNFFADGPLVLVYFARRRRLVRKALEDAVDGVQ